MKIGLAQINTTVADGPAVVVGALLPSGQTQLGHPGLYNTAMLLQRGKARVAAQKRLLPGYVVSPRFSGQLVKPLKVIVHRHVGSCNPGPNASVADCKTLW